MLYVTTRTDRDAFTICRAMTCDFGPDGGQFLPMLAPRFGEDDLLALSRRSFNENMAHILGMLYRKKLTGRDIDLVTGKRSVHLLDLNSRTIVAEVWRNLDCDFSGYVQRLFRLMVREPEEKPGQWFTMSVRIAVLFAVFGALMAKGIVSPEGTLDVSVPSFDFQYPMAAWYARRWGLPIGTIICCCNENNAPWSLIHQGEMRTDMAVRRTSTAACDQAVPAGLERLIHGTLGMEEARRYAAAVAGGRPYTIEPEQQAALRAGISVSVVSQRRMAFMIPNIYRTDTWYPDPYAAMAYTGLVDHRAAPGDTGKALIISEEDPVYSTDMLSGFLGIGADAVRQKIENR